VSIESAHKVQPSGLWCKQENQEPAGPFR